MDMWDHVLYWIDTTEVRVPHHLDNMDVKAVCLFGKDFALTEFYIEAHNNSITLFSIQKKHLGCILMML